MKPLPVLSKEQVEYIKENQIMNKIKITYRLPNGKIGSTITIAHLVEEFKEQLTANKCLIINVEKWK